MIMLGLKARRRISKGERFMYKYQSCRGRHFDRISSRTNNNNYDTEIPSAFNQPQIYLTIINMSRSMLKATVRLLLRSDAIVGSNVYLIYTTYWWPKIVYKCRLFTHSRILILIL